MSTDPRITQFHNDSEKVMQFLHAEYAKLQTGRASAALVEHVMVEAYGQKQPLKAVAGIGIQDARTITVQPWDKSVMSTIEKALQQAELGANPTNDGTLIRISLPPMTEERRTQLTKIVQQLAEDARISIRQKRQEIHDAIKKDEKDEDMRYTLLDQLQKAVEAANEKIESIRAGKEDEVMKV